MEEYDFQNIFELMGIEAFDNVEYLKAIINHTAVKIRNNISKENRSKENELRFKALDLEREKKKKVSEYQSLNKTSEEIEALTKEYDEKIKDTIEKANGFRKNLRKLFEQVDTYLNSLTGSNNITELLYHYIKLESLLVNDVNRSGNADFGKELTEEQKEHKKIVNYANRMFKTPQSVEEYIYDKIYPLGYIDTDNRDMSKYTYKKSTRLSSTPDFLYQAKIDEPRKIMEAMSYSGKTIKVYDVGNFGFGQWIKMDEKTKKMRATYHSGTYNLVTVVIKDEEKEVIYNGVIYLHEQDIKENTDFYANVVFSELAMKNAMKNNFGYIGAVENTDNGRRLHYKEVESMDVVRALSYAQTHRSISGRTLPELIEKSNQNLLEDKILDNNDEGGR